MALPQSFYQRTIADNTVDGRGNPETTNVEFALTTLTSANVTAQEGLITDLSVAIAGITLGRIVGSSIVWLRGNFEKIPSDNPLAQRENKWLCRYHDAVTFQKMDGSIGTADLSLLADHSEFLDLTAGEGLAFKSAFEAVVKSKYDATHAVILDSVQFVGRST